MVNTPVTNFVGAFNKLAGTMNPENKSAVLLLDAARRNSITLEFRSGKTICLRSLLVSHNLEDLTELFHRIGTDHPDLILVQDQVLIRDALDRQRRRPG
jgi:hypothetical protein